MCFSSMPYMSTLLLAQVSTALRCKHAACYAAALPFVTFHCHRQVSAQPFYHSNINLHRLQVL
jgi:hypothetical protein